MEHVGNRLHRLLIVAWKHSCNQYIMHTLHARSVRIENYGPLNHVLHDLMPR